MSMPYCKLTYDTNASDICRNERTLTRIRRNIPHMKTFLQDRIRSARKEAGLTQQALSDKIGIARAAVAQWETGATTSIEGNNLMRAAKALGVSAQWLIDGTGEKEEVTLSSREQTIITELRQLPEDQQLMVFHFIGSILYPRDPRQATEEENRVFDELAKPSKKSTNNSA